MFLLILNVYLIRYTKNHDIVDNRHAILSQLTDNSLTVSQLLKTIPYKEQKTLPVIRFMTDNRQLEQDNDMRLKVKS